MKEVDVIIEDDGLMHIDDYYYTLIKYRDFVCGNNMHDDIKMETLTEKLDEWYTLFRGIKK